MLTFIFSWNSVRLLMNVQHMFIHTELQKGNEGDSDPGKTGLFVHRSVFTDEWLIVKFDKSPHWVDIRWKVSLNSMKEFTVLILFLRSFLH